MVISLTKQNFQTEVQQSSKPVVIDVYATWCGPCKVVAPLFEELSKELGDKYTFAKLNVDEAREIATEYRVTSVPTFLFIKNNKLVGKEIGNISKEDLRSRIEDYLG
jgi:thioredoxin 1